MKPSVDVRPIIKDEHDVDDDDDDEEDEGSSLITFRPISARFALARYQVPV